MNEPGGQYAVELKVHEPKLGVERRFIVAERRYVDGQLAKTAGTSWTTWRPVKVGALGVFRREDWQRYAHALENYSRALDRYEAEMADGLVPFKIFVSNLGTQADTNVNVRVKVEHGAIHEAKQAPERPARLDASRPVPSPKRPAWLAPGGFARRKIEIGRHELRAEFSRLGAGESAELVRQTLHLAADDATQLRYELRSQLVGGMSGFVDVLED